MASLVQDINHNPSKLRIIKNLVVISSSFALLFSGFQGLSLLQNTTNKEDGFSPLSQSLMYLMFCISSLLFPKYVIQKLGCKFSIILSQILYIPWIASNFCPHWIAMLPSAILVGIAASTLWSAQCTYFNKASVLYCSLIEDEVKVKPKDSFKASTKSDFSLEPLSVQSSLKLTETSISRRNADVQVTCDSTFHNESLKDSSYIYYENCDSNVADYGNPCSGETSTECVVQNPELSANNRNSCTQKDENFISFASHEAVNARFFALHSLVSTSSEIWSNLVYYYVSTIESNEMESNELDVSSCSCGANFCNVESECLVGNIGGVSEKSRYLFSGISVALLATAVILLLLCLDSIEGKREPVKFSLGILMATWNQCKKIEQILLIPITLLLGLVQGFYTADITKAYIGCAWDAHHVGLVSVASGMACVISSPMFGYLVRHIGRIPIIFLGIAVTIGTNILLLTWTPDVSQPHVFYLIASFWGVIMATVWAQIPAFYGVIFKEDEEAAFATFYLWYSLGWTISLFYSNFLCTYIKIYILIFVACTGFIGYLIAERKFALRKSEISQQSSPHL